MSHQIWDTGLLGMSLDWLMLGTNMAKLRYLVSFRFGFCEKNCNTQYFRVQSFHSFCFCKSIGCFRHIVPFNYNHQGIIFIIIIIIIHDMIYLFNDSCNVK